MSPEVASSLTALPTGLDLHSVLGFVCGQNRDHTWAPGGLPLPCCQRCLGLYAGAALAFLLHLCSMPKLTNRFLEWHGAFLLIMVPLGFHWVPQGPFLRSVSGVLFGAGVVTYLWLPLAHRYRRSANTGTQDGGDSHSPQTYVLGLTLCAVLLPVLASGGGRLGALVLSAAALTGLFSLAALATGNLLLGIRQLLLRRNPSTQHSERVTGISP